MAASAFYFPKNLPAVYGALGGLGLGALAADRRIKGKHEDDDHALRVGQAFSDLYEANRGLVSPDQLAIASNIKPKVAYDFVQNVASEYNIGPIQTAQGVVFSFPHPSNALDELGNNAKNWVDNQQQQMLQQMEQLQKRMTVITKATRERTAQIPQPSMQVPQELEATVDNPWL